MFGSGLRRPEGVDVQPRATCTGCRRGELTAFIECAGNGRRFFASQQGTPAAGSAWKLGAIGVARWRGVPLAEVLERAGIRRGAVDVMPEGLDANVVTDGVDYGHVRRPLPIGKALDDALLAYEMNGEALPPDHGAPAAARRARLGRRSRASSGSAGSRSPTGRCPRPGTRSGTG